MSRIPHIVKRANGRWDVTTTLAELDGGYFLAEVYVAFAALLAHRKAKGGG